MTQNMAASYAWVSSDGQQSIMAQLERIRRFSDEQGLTIAREYEDEGDGGATDDRPGFQRMIADARSPEKLFDTIIVHDLSRLSSSVSVLPVQEPARGGSGQAVERYRRCRVLNAGGRKLSGRERQDFTPGLRRKEQHIKTRPQIDFYQTRAKPPPAIAPENHRCHRRHLAASGPSARRWDGELQ